MGGDGLPLARALSSLRAEVSQAAEAARQEGLRFKVESITVELQVVATASGGGTAGAGLWRVVQFGGRADYSRASTHKVTLTIIPEHPEGAGDATTTDVYVGDDVPHRPR